ncbi:MAG: hypothetical protein F6K18_24835 [Okeania sp. SIO2C2]|uniref:hypothetical protein n=1 Tax=Okeania sp. SIO2C2 TaxID=2607787 RepID=UPI0013B8D437|nr:hypothetical protein [Okeania sp. SIO2C2]NEP89794.1 hypothetical protein [Okeania sp. SIO2C2]
MVLRGSQSQKALPKNHVLQKSIHHFKVDRPVVISKRNLFITQAIFIDYRELIDVPKKY